jgi:O-antigen ligase
MTALPVLSAGAEDATAGATQSDAPHRPKRRYQLRTGNWALDLACFGVVLMGFNRWRAGGFTVSDFMFVMAGAVVVVRLLTGRSRSLAPAESRRSSLLVLCGALTLLTGCTLSSFGAWDPLGSIGVVLRLAWLTLIWFWLLRSVAVNRAAFNRLLVAWRVALVLSAGCALLTELGLANLTVNNNESRQTAFFDHPNDLGGFLVVGLPLVVLAIPRREDRRLSDVLWHLAGIGLIGYGIVTTGSMSAAVAAVAGLVTTFTVLTISRDPRRKRRRHPLLSMLALATAGVVLVVLSTSDLPLVTRITELNQGNSYITGSVESRGVMNRSATERIDQLLVVGIGLDRRSEGKIVDIQDTATAHVQDQSGIHNIFLKVLLEAGLPALIGLWIIIGATLLQAWRLLFNLRDDPLIHAAVAALFGSVVTINVFAMFQPTLYHRYYWYPMALIGVLWALRRQELREPRRGGNDAYGRSYSRSYPTAT